MDLAVNLRCCTEVSNPSPNSFRADCQRRERTTDRKQISRLRALLIRLSVFSSANRAPTPHSTKNNDGLFSIALTADCQRIGSGDVSSRITRRINNVRDDMSGLADSARVHPTFYKRCAPKKRDATTRFAFSFYASPSARGVYPERSEGTNIKYNGDGRMATCHLQGCGTKITRRDDMR